MFSVQDVVNSQVCVTKETQVKSDNRPVRPDLVKIEAYVPGQIQNRKNKERCLYLRLLFANKTCCSFNKICYVLSLFCYTLGRERFGFMIVNHSLSARNDVSVKCCDW